MWNVTFNVFGDSNDENNCPHKFLLSSTQILRLHKAGFLSMLLGTPGASLLGNLLTG